MDKMRNVKEVKIIKEKQILKLKNTVNGDTWNRKNQQPINQAEGEIYEVEDRSFEITVKRITKKKWKWWMNEKEWRRWRRLTWTVSYYITLLHYTMKYYITLWRETTQHYEL